MKHLLLFLGMASITMAGHAQIDTRDLHRAFDEFRNEVHEDFDNFRQEITMEFIEFLRNPWKEFEAEEPIPKPIEKEVPPVVMPEEDKDKPIEDKPVVVDDTIKPAPIEPQPKPIEPIEEVPVLVEKTVSFDFYGNKLKVRYDDSQSFKLRSLSENEVANAVQVLSTELYDNTIYDCLSIRDNLKLCDWGYLLMLKTLSDKLCGTGSNESTLLYSYIYIQSGYRARIARDEKKLYLLFASKHIIYQQASFTINGENFYCIDNLPDRLKISDAALPEEKSLSLQITQQQKFAFSASDARKIVSKSCPEMQVVSKVNKNMVDFYNTYPSSFYGDDFMTRWAIYANTPLENDITRTLYPALRQHIAGKSEIEAANRLLNWVQTGFVYEYDDKVWGGDRAFFAEETLYYPYCDCEDRSILFSRLVRDLLGLDVVLVYYPGHLATAVSFSGEVKGDYLMLNGHKFVVADPTYIGAPVGYTMPKMDNLTAKVIMLR